MFMEQFKDAVCRLFLQIYIYIYIYSILGPVKPELGVIPSGQEVIHE